MHALKLSMAGLLTSPKLGSNKSLTFALVAFHNDISARFEDEWVKDAQSPFSVPWMLQLTSSHAPWVLACKLALIVPHDMIGCTSAHKIIHQLKRDLQVRDGNEDQRKKWMASALSPHE